MELSGDKTMIIAKFKVGDKVKRSKRMVELHGVEFTGGKEIEEIVKIQMPIVDDGVIMYWLANGRWCSESMIQLAEGTDKQKEIKNE